MWISRQLKNDAVQPRAERGNVLVSNDDGFGAGGTVAMRDVKSYAPYGYTSAPPVGEEVMLLPSTDGQVLIGTRASSSVEAGEIMIKSLGGAYIHLKNDGSIVLNGLVIDKNGVIHN